MFHWNVVILLSNKSIMNMTNVINTLGLHTTNFINGRNGSYRIVYKCKAGFMSISEGSYNNSLANEMGPSALLDGWKKGSLQTIQFQAYGSNPEVWLTVFAMKGKKCVVIDEDILKGLTVGTINQYFSNTNLYSQMQYSAVNAKNWASKAFVMNEAA